jgi:hypothetical protein
MAAGTASDATYALKAAVRTALLADSYLNSTLVGLKVVDDAPASHATPYISIDTRSNDWSTSDTDGQEILLDLNVWSQPTSQTPETATGRDIMAAARRVLHTAVISPASPFHAVLIRVENMLGPFKDPDGTTMHGVVSIRALTDHD